MVETTDFSCLLTTRTPHSVLYTSSRLNLYQRLIQYFSIVNECGGQYLDLINFNRDLFPEVLSLQQTESLFSPEHGYGCPDGSLETGQLIRAYESARASRFLRMIDATARVQIDFEKNAVGIGAGTTGVINCLVPAVRDYYLSRGAKKKPIIVLTVPLYSVYDGIVSEHGLQPQYLFTRPESKFLPTPEEVEEVLNNRPMALILTYPTNPAQSTYDHTRWKELKKIAEMCQNTETFLIVDNVYQDTLWQEGQCNPEIFSLLDTSDFILKVFGPSKDRPGCSGFRIGYYCGDPRIREAFFYYSSIQYNTPNSSSRCYLALDLLFRLLKLEHRSLSKSDLELLNDYLAGWGRPMNRATIFERLNTESIFQKYLSELAQTEERQRESNCYLQNVLHSLDGFSDVVNDNIGNVLLVRVNEDWFPGTCHDLFLYLLKQTRIGVLPANAFGFPIEPANAWFRFTIIHDRSEHIAEKIHKVDEAIRNWRRFG